MNSQQWQLPDGPAVPQSRAVQDQDEDVEMGDNAGVEVLSNMNWSQNPSASLNFGPVGTSSSFPPPQSSSSRRTWESTIGMQSNIARFTHEMPPAVDVPDQSQHDHTRRRFQDAIAHPTQQRIFSPIQMPAVPSNTGFPLTSSISPYSPSRRPFESLVAGPAQQMNFQAAQRPAVFSNQNPQFSDSPPPNRRPFESQIAGFAQQANFQSTQRPEVFSNRTLQSSDSSPPYRRPFESVVGSQSQTSEFGYGVVDWLAQRDKEYQDRQSSNRRPMGTATAGPGQITQPQILRPPLGRKLPLTATIPTDDFRRESEAGTNPVQARESSQGGEKVANVKRARRGSSSPVEQEAEYSTRIDKKRAINQFSNSFPAKTVTQQPVSTNAYSSDSALPPDLDHVSKFWGLDDLEIAIPEDDLLPEIRRGDIPMESPYRPLPYKDSIRVLRIEPANSGLLTAQLEVTSLSHLDHKYEAISYVWGDPTRRAEIETPDGILNMTKNLKDAIQQLRLPDRPRFIWADAICIHQNDSVEKTQQVRLMRKIYKAASRVLIWLGQDVKRKAVMAFSVVCSIASGGSLGQNQVGQANFYSNGVSSAHIPDLPCREMPPVDYKALWGAASELFDCTWFWRVWCLQEVALAREALMIWGTCEISWNHVGLAAARLRTNYYSILQRYDLRGVYNAYLMYRISQSVPEIEPLRFPFLHLMSLTRQFESTDARDRIYGLLGIPTTDNNPDTEELPVTPNYSLSTLEVYRQLAVWVLRNQGSTFQLLRAVQHGDGIDDAWLSWVPRWDSVFTHSLAPSDIESQPAEVVAGADKKTIHVQGRRMCVVAKMLPKLHDSSGNNLMANLNLEQFILGGSENQKCLCWTLTAGKTWYGLAVSQPDEQLGDFAAYVSAAFPHLQNALAGLRQEASDGQRFVQAALAAYEGRRLFLTDDGMLGLGPAALQDGDVVVDFAVAPSTRWTTFAVRECPNNQTRLVGACYVYDLQENRRSGVAMMRQWWELI